MVFGFGSQGLFLSSQFSKKAPNLRILILAAFRSLSMLLLRSGFRTHK